MIFPDIKAWERHVQAKQTVEELNGALDLLRKGETQTAGIHLFHLAKPRSQMGLAVWMLDERAKKLGFSKHNFDGTYYKSHTSHIKPLDQ